MGARPIGVCSAIRVKKESSLALAPNVLATHKLWPHFTPRPEHYVFVAWRSLLRSSRRVFCDFTPDSWVVLPRIKTSSLDQGCYALRSCNEGRQSSWGQVLHIIGNSRPDAKRGNWVKWHFFAIIRLVFSHLATNCNVELSDHAQEAFPNLYGNPECSRKRFIFHFSNTFTDWSRDRNAWLLLLLLCPLKAKDLSRLNSFLSI